MMANAYGYTPDDMRSVGQTLQTIQGEIGDKITAAQSAVNGLIGSGFTTAAASGAYSDQFQQLSTALQNVSQSLGPLGQFLSQYADTVEEVDSQFGSQLQG